MASRSNRSSSPLRLGRRYAQAGREQLREATSVRRIILTGGPGGGKSTATAFLAREFAGDLWVVPEVATLLYRGGLPRGTSPRGIHLAQKAIFDVQRALERTHAIQNPEFVQLCDRGSIDGAAYWPDGPDAFFAAMGTSLGAELARYEAVIFMHTAARLPAGYDQDFKTRNEERELAMQLDRRVYDLYKDHPNFVVIESSGSFLEKLTTVTKVVQDLVSPQARNRASKNSSDSIGGREFVPRSALASLASTPHVLPDTPLIR